MRIGVVFPQTELGGDAGAVRAWAQRAGELGFTHVLAYDHVAGADPAVHTGWDGPYDVRTTFHEPMVLYGYLAAVTSLELVTGVIILPQRQTVLAAKQAAKVELLTGGKFRLGVGIGWNCIEYEALGQDFSTRGKRLEEQITLLRRLWTEQTVTFSGTFYRITGAGLAPMPVQRPIPVWVGAQSPRAYRRAGRLADGWFPQMAPGPQLDQARRIVAEAAAEAGWRPRWTWRARGCRLRGWQQPGRGASPLCCPRSARARRGGPPTTSTPRRSPACCATARGCRRLPSGIWHWPGTGSGPGPTRRPRCAASPSVSPSWHCRMAACRY